MWYKSRKVLHVQWTLTNVPCIHTVKKDEFIHQELKRPWERTRSIIIATWFSTFFSFLLFLVLFIFMRLSALLGGSSGRWFPIDRLVPQVKSSSVITALPANEKRPDAYWLLSTPTITPPPPLGIPPTLLRRHHAHDLSLSSSSRLPLRTPSIDFPLPPFFFLPPATIIRRNESTRQTIQSAHPPLKVLLLRRSSNFKNKTNKLSGDRRKKCLSFYFRFYPVVGLWFEVCCVMSPCHRG